MPAVAQLHETDPKDALIAKIGDVSGVELFHNQVLCAAYLSPGKTKGGILRPDQTKDEDLYQSKVGLILKMGPKAFLSEGAWSWPDDMAVGDWVFFRVSDGWNTTVNSFRMNVCRILHDVDIRGRIPHPDMIW